MSFRQSIVWQVSQKKRGIIFSSGNLVFPQEKLANVAVILSDLCKIGTIMRFEKGAYYRPYLSTRKSCPTERAILEYLTSKSKGYVSGRYAYDYVGLKQDLFSEITIASCNPIRHIEINGLKVVFVKAYVDKVASKDIGMVYLLDTIKDIKNIPGHTEQDVYDTLKQKCIKALPLQNIERLVRLSQKYPPRVRKILGDMLEDINEISLRDKVIQSLYPTTRYVLNYAKSPIYPTELK